MSQNPYLSEIDALVTDIMDLQVEVRAAAPDEAARIRAEIAAKTTLINELQALSEDWRLNRIGAAVERLQQLAQSELARQARAGARLRRLLERQGVRLPDPAPAPTPDPAPAPVPAPAPAPTPAQPAPQGDHVTITIEPRDFDALCRVAQSEVGHFGRYGAEQLSGGICAVIETVLNRVAHRSFPDTVQGVIDQRFQFSAINKTGSWTGLPEARPELAAIVQDYLERRVAGTPGTLGGATHFLNPHLSSQSSLTTWGNHVVRNPVAVFGDDDRKDVHFHGFAPGTPLPKPHVIVFGTASPVFDERDHAAAAGRADGLRAGIVKTLEAELAFFGNGRHKETDDPHFRRVGDYWQAIGERFDGRTEVVAANGTRSRPPWSAAFISWVIKQQGLEAARFRGAQAHCRYVADLLDGTLPNPLYEVIDPALCAPQPGDILHFGRGDPATTFDLAMARETLRIDSFYTSHSDFVLSVDREKKTLTAVGGNLSDSVKSVTLKLDDAGLLRPRGTAARPLPWIAVLRLRED